MLIPNRIFSKLSGQNLFRSCAGEGVRRGKTDSGMKQQVRGNWIPSMLQTTRLHTRLTRGHAKDAQTLAKVFLQRTSDWYFVSVSLSSLGLNVCSFAAFLLFLPAQLRFWLQVITVITFSLGSSLLICPAIVCFCLYMQKNNTF